METHHIVVRDWNRIEFLTNFRSKNTIESLYTISNKGHRRVQTELLSSVGAALRVNRQEYEASERQFFVSKHVTLCSEKSYGVNREREY
jgi:hypothetical protein